MSEPSLAATEAQRERTIFALVSLVAGIVLLPCWDAEDAFESHRALVLTGLGGGAAPSPVVAVFFISLAAFVWRAVLRRKSLRVLLVPVSATLLYALATLHGIAVRRSTAGTSANIRGTRRRGTRRT